MKNLNKLFLLSTCLLSGIVFSSCDKEYDLSKDIDTTINIGKNLQIPVGQTVKIPLSRLVTESNIISTNQDGVYLLHTSGAFDSHISDVNPFYINGLSPQFSEFIIEDLPQVNVPYIQEIPITIESKATYEIAETKTQLPNEVEALFYAEFNEGNGAISHITIGIPDTDNGTNGINEVNLHNVFIKFPEIFTLQDGSHEVFFEDIYLNASNNFTKDITIIIHDIQIGAEEQSKYITELDGKKYFSLQEKISFESETTVKVIPSLIKDSKMHFSFGYSIEPAAITKVNGIVTPDVTINETLSLEDIPSFIKDDECSFVPNDITFEFSINNPVGMNLHASISITPWNNTINAPSGNSISIPLIGENAIKPEVTSKYIISNKPCEVGADVINIVNEDITSLLATIPDAYKISTSKIIANGTDANGLKLGESFNIIGDYNVNIPFEFSDISIKYSDEIKDLQNDLKDITKLVDKIALEFDFVSTLPIELEASFDLLDAHDNTLNQITISGNEANKIHINASQNGEEAVTHLTLMIEEKKDSNQLELLDKIKFTIKAKNPNQKDVVLKSSQYIMLKNGVAKLPNGITTDF